MRRFIFQSHKNKQPPADRLPPHHGHTLRHDSVISRQSSAQTDKSLVSKPVRMGALATLLIGGIVWLGYNKEQNLPITEQALSIPTNTSVTSTVKQAPAAPTVTVPAHKTATPIPAVAVSNLTNDQNSTQLSSANAQAIRLAQQGDGIAAVTQLEQALLNDPEAGPAFNNLRRLYAGFATQSYELAINPSKHQDVLVELVDQQKQKHTVTLVADANTQQRQIPLLTDQVKEAVTLPAATINNTLPPTGVNPAASNSALAANTTPAPQAVTTTAMAIPPKPTPPKLTAEDRKELNKAIMSALKNWAEAWSQKNVDGYLNSYSPTYAPKGTSHKDWADYRRVRIQAPHFIKVELSDQNAILHDATHAKVTFTQSYASDTLKARDKKVVDMELIDNKWLITFESGR